VGHDLRSFADSHLSAGFELCQLRLLGGQLRPERLRSGHGHEGQCDVLDELSLGGDLRLDLLEPRSSAVQELAIAPLELRDEQLDPVGAREDIAQVPHDRSADLPLGDGLGVRAYR